MRKVRDARDLSSNELVFFKGHARATYMSDGANVEDAINVIGKANEKYDEDIEELKNATYKNKGYFKNAQQLEGAYPASSLGSRAYVGTNYPYAIYLWDDATMSWVDSGEVGGDESLDLSQYYTKEEVEDRIKSYIEVISQNAYDALAKKEKKFYATTS